MKKTYDRKVFKRKLLSDRRTVTVTIRLFMILLLGFPLLTRAGTVDSTRVANREVRGKVVDEKKLPIPGVSVRLGGTSMGTATDVDGKFKLLIPADTATLVVSFIGMKTEIVKIPRLKVGAEQKELTIVLREEDVKLEDVVVTGIFTRKKESFTGSASTYSAAELKTMGTQNVLQSLKTLDPAFAIIEDNQFGSDPNRLPNMEIRGKSSMLGLRDELDADPNQPLFPAVSLLSDGARPWRDANPLGGGSRQHGHRVECPRGRFAPGPYRNERIADFRRPALRCRRRRRFPVRTQCRVADAAHHPEQYARLADAAFRVGRSPDALGQ